MRILSVQSSVAFGHAGNSAAVFPLQRLGHDVIPVYTVHFSNHTGYETWHGPVFSANDVAAVIQGVRERGALDDVDAVLTGYQGDKDVGRVIVETVDSLRAHNSDFIYCCDPVMGDVRGGFFVRDGIPQFMRSSVVPKADVVTPNHFELDYLAGTQSSTRAEVLDAISAVQDLGPQTVLATSVVHDELPADTLAMIAAAGDAAWEVQVPLLPITPGGCGDITAALFLAHLPSGIDQALGRTAASTQAVLDATLAAGTRELQLIPSQEALVHTEPLPVVQLA